MAYDLTGPRSVMSYRANKLSDHRTAGRSAKHGSGLYAGRYLFIDLGHPSGEHRLLALLDLQGSVIADPVDHALVPVEAAAEVDAHEIICVF